MKENYQISKWMQSCRHSILNRSFSFTSVIFKVKWIRRWFCKEWKEENYITFYKRFSSIDLFTSVLPNFQCCLQSQCRQYLIIIILFWMVKNHKFRSFNWKSLLKIKSKYMHITYNEYINWMRFQLKYPSEMNISSWNWVLDLQLGFKLCSRYILVKKNFILIYWNV